MSWASKSSPHNLSSKVLGNNQVPIWKDFFGTPFEAASIFTGNFYEATMLWGLAENASNRGGLRPSNKTAKSVKWEREWR